MPRITANELRAESEWDCEIAPGKTVRLRKIDLTSAYMMGYVTLPLMAAVGRLIELGKQVKENPEKFAEVPDADRKDSMELMRRYACAACIDPVFVLEDDGNPDHVPVSLLSGDQLVAIWKSGPPKPKV